MKLQNTTSLYSRPSYQKNAQPAFKGHWETRYTGAPYPYENTSVHIESYVADADESFDEINRNFLSRAQGNRDMFRHESQIYTIGGTNFFVDFSKNREYKKMELTRSAEENIKNEKWVDAVDDKLKIANILKEQGPKMERDKFLTEEGIRTIFHKADPESRLKILGKVIDYNIDMAAALLKKFHVK